MRSFAILGASVLLVDGFRAQPKKHSKARQTDNFSPYDGQAALGVKICDSQQLDQLLEITQTCTFLTEFFDGLPADGSCIEDTMVCDQEVVPKLLGQGFRFAVELLQKDAGAYFRSAIEPPRPFNKDEPEGDFDFFWEWQSLDAMNTFVERAAGSKMEVVGKSLEGRDMRIFRFTGKGYQPGGPKVVVTYNLHAREWITGMAGAYAVDQLAYIMRNDPGYLDGVEVVLMPMANPDGFKHTEDNARFHRKNTNTNNSLCMGTDLNRNFPTGWDTCSSLQCGSSVPCLDTFKGREAGSEPETKVIMNLLQESEMTVMIDVHSFTQLVLASWGWTNEPHPREAEFTALGTKMTEAIAGKHDTTWRFGTPPQILYKAVGTLTDYATSLGALGYCFELRPQSKAWSLFGFAPPTKMIRPAAEEAFEGLLVAIEYAKSQV